MPVVSDFLRSSIYVSFSIPFGPKPYLTETPEYNFEIHNIVLSSQSISLITQGHITACPLKHSVLYK